MLACAQPSLDEVGVSAHDDGGDENGVEVLDDAGDDDGLPKEDPDELESPSESGRGLVEPSRAPHSAWLELGDGDHGARGRGRASAARATSARWNGLLRPPGAGPAVGRVAGGSGRSAVVVHADRWCVGGCVLCGRTGVGEAGGE